MVLLRSTSSSLVYSDRARSHVISHDRSTEPLLPSRIFRDLAGPESPGLPPSPAAGPAAGPASAGGPCIFAACSTTIASAFSSESAGLLCVAVYSIRRALKEESTMRASSVLAPRAMALAKAASTARSRIVSPTSPAKSFTASVSICVNTLSMVKSNSAPFLFSASMTPISFPFGSRIGTASAVLTTNPVVSPSWSAFSVSRSDMSPTTTASLLPAAWPTIPSPTRTRMAPLDSPAAV